MDDNMTIYSGLKFGPQYIHFDKFGNKTKSDLGLVNNCDTTQFFSDSDWNSKSQDNQQFVNESFKNYLCPNIRQFKTIVISQ